jgi:FkbH-like protein
MAAEAGLSLIDGTYGDKVTDRMLLHRSPGLRLNQLAKCRGALAASLLEPLRGMEKYAATLAAMGVEGFTAWEVHPLTDYLIRYLKTGDEVWRDAYLGKRLEQLHHLSTEDHDTLLKRNLTVIRDDRKNVIRLLTGRLDAESLKVIEERMQAVETLPERALAGGHELRVLLVGDCLFTDIMKFLSAALLERGITVRPEYVGGRDPVECRNAIRGLKGRGFDLICYSPYTYEFSVGLLETQYKASLLPRRRELDRMAADAHAQTQSTLRLLRELFDCSLCVQNTGNLRRLNRTLGSFLKNFATRNGRRRAAEGVNALLRKALTEMNEDGRSPVVLMDEAALESKHGEWRLARKYYDSEPEHPTVLAQKLAGMYRDAMTAAKFLRGKKVVVIDLDDTVWEGTIGEGAVRHYAERQMTLKLLKNKGILLAVASKNDPGRVHWTGGVLQSPDFVAEQIHWDPKPVSIRRIAADLNLKLKDFVFVDDRPDQREMVKASIPEVYTLDATDESSWKMLHWWAVSLPEQNETDRTQLYHERRQRESFLEDEELHQQALLAMLGLKVQIRPARVKERPRVAELINRTNQFNTTGSRTSLQQVAAWSESREHCVLVAEASDKFGHMGVISAMVLEVNEDALAIGVWVLSCRVFGYGIETAMLNYVRRLGGQMQREAITGTICETASNHHCREVYLHNGFALEGSQWRARVAEVLPEPEWLAVECGPAQDALAMA